MQLRLAWQIGDGTLHFEEVRLMQLNIKNEPICTRHRAEAEASSLSNSTLRTADSRKIKDANCLDLYSQERTVRKLCRRLFFFFFARGFHIPRKGTDANRQLEVSGG